MLAVEYRKAPEHPFPVPIDDCVRAYGALLRSGVAPEDVVVAGDSAGGGLALALAQRLRATGTPQPRALVLLSPWTDLGNSGDSHRALADIDPVLAYDPGLRLSAAAYAPGAEDHPDASPLLADYDAGFPPTLIVCGSREILLSDSLRLHRRLRAAGATAEIDVHDGLFHSFTTVAPKSPEAAEARSGIRRFVDRNRL